MSARLSQALKSGKEKRLAACGTLSHTMIAALMLVFSWVALVNFFASYCRSLLLACAQPELSIATRRMIGTEASQICGEQFAQLMGLVRIAPVAGNDKWELRAVSVYYAAVRAVGVVASPLVPVVRQWAQQQSDLCANFAAVALDHRIEAVGIG